MESDNYIEKLLEKYFEATITVDQEDELKAYFAQEEVTPNLEQYRPLFAYFSTAKKEQYTKQIPLKSRKKINYGWVSIVAAFVLAFGIYFSSNSYQNYLDRKEAEFAYQQTKKALNLLVDNFDKGRKHIAQLNEFTIAKSKVFNEN